MRQIVLLRGINIGSRNRIAMPALRELLTAAGMGGVRTYVQSGNVVLDSDATTAELASDCRKLIAREFDLQIAVVVRTRDELARVVARNPLSEFASDPKRLQVTFMDAEPEAAVVQRLAERATGEERLLADGRELYTWHAAGIARSKLWEGIAGRRLGVTATSRNWTTVCALLAMAGE